MTHRMARRRRQRLYRDSTASKARQAANRRSHRANSPVWQPTENDKD
jgi:hypothetical protein